MNKEKWEQLYKQIIKEKMNFGKLKITLIYHSSKLTKIMFTKIESTLCNDDKNIIKEKNYEQ